MTKIQICFVIIKKMFFDDKKSDLFCCILKKNENDFSFKKRVSLII